MSSRHVKVRNSGPIALIATLLVSVGTLQAHGQSTFDPYNPSTGQYQEFVTPSYPSNLALPGQSRQANALNQQVLYGTKVGANSFDRFLQDGFEDRFSPGITSLNDLSRGRITGPGVPYYISNRAPDYAPTRDAERDFNLVRQERERRYFEAIREKDPVKRAKLLRRVNEHIDAQDLLETNQPNKGTAEERQADDRSGTARSGSGSNFRIARNREPSSSQIGREALATATPRSAPSVRMPMAGESIESLPSSLSSPRGSAATPGRSPARSGTLPPPAPARRRMSAGPDRRPSLPSEVIDRNREGGSAKPATGTGSSANPR